MAPRDPHREIPTPDDDRDLEVRVAILEERVPHDNLHRVSQVPTNLGAILDKIPEKFHEEWPLVKRDVQNLVKLGWVVIIAFVGAIVAGMVSWIHIAKP